MPRSTSHEIARCKQILQEIDSFIPKVGYVKPVQEIFRKKGQEIPNRNKILNVRRGSQYDLEIVKALREISQPMDENDNPVPPQKWNVKNQTKLEFHQN